MSLHTQASIRLLQRDNKHSVYNTTKQISRFPGHVLILRSQWSYLPDGLYPILATNYWAELLIPQWSCLHTKCRYCMKYTSSTSSLSEPREWNLTFTTWLDASFVISLAKNFQENPLNSSKISNSSSCRHPDTNYCMPKKVSRIFSAATRLWNSHICAEKGR